MRISKNYLNQVNVSSFLSTIAIMMFVIGANAAGMRDISTMALVKDMGLGINLGNTFESNGSWINGTTVNAYETAWGSPTITKAMIDGYASAGFKTVRIPVAWSNLMTGNNPGGTYTISADLLNRVEEVVDWVLADGMYAIVNIHHDGGWWEKFSTDSAECMKKYISIWTQISNKFKDKSDYLMLESLNEEGIWQDVWNQYDNSGNKARAFGLLNAINQKFVDIVRASGGNNGERHLLIAGYATNIDRTCDQAFKMPTDEKKRCAVSVHYYDPFGFTHLEQNESWATLRMTWGTAADYNELNGYMDKMKTNFVNKDIPVIVGEYGFASKLDRGVEEIRKYTLAVAEAIYTRNMCPVLWDIQWDASKGERIYYYDRKTASFTDPQLISGFKEIAGDNTTTAVNHKNRNDDAKLKHQQITVRGKTLSVNASPDSKVRIRVVDLTGRTVGAFKSIGGASFSLRAIPAGAYIVETMKDGRKTMSAITLR